MASQDRPRLDCGWNIPDSIRKAVISEINAWKPSGRIEKRDKKICLLAFKKNMNAAQIERLQDPALVNQWGKPLTSKGIMVIIYRHFPQLRRRRGYSVTTEGHRKRLDLQHDFDKITAGKPRQCGICGSLEHLRLHHIVPIDHGGTNDPVNLLFICETCHRDLHERIYKTWGQRGQSRKRLEKEWEEAAGITADEVKRIEQPKPKHKRAKKETPQPVETVICYSSETGETTVQTTNKEIMLSLSTAEDWKEVEAKRKKSGRLESVIFSCEGNPIRRSAKA